MWQNYRTYKNLFKVKPEISSLGSGPKRFRFSEGFSISLDMVFIFVVSIPIMRITFAPIFALILSTQQVLPWLSWIYAIALAGTVAYLTRKLEPAGKSVTMFIFSFLSFLMRNKWSDGWDKKNTNLYEGNEFRVTSSYLDGKNCGDLPAVGAADEFELLTPAVVHVRGKMIVVQKHGKRLEPGIYQRVGTGKKAKITMKHIPQIKRPGRSVT